MYNHGGQLLLGIIFYIYLYRVCIIATGCGLITINSAFLMNSLALRVYFILDLPSQKEARHLLARA